MINGLLPSALAFAVIASASAKPLIRIDSASAIATNLIPSALAFAVFTSR